MSNFTDRIRKIGGLIIKRRKYMNRIEDELTKRLPYKPTKHQIKWCYWDYFKYTVKYIADLDIDYFNAGIFRKSELVREESFANKKRFIFRDNIQNKEKWIIFQDKIEFYNSFKDYLGRDYIIIKNSSKYNEFKDFIIKHNNDVFAKNPVSCGGKDVFHWNFKSEDEIKSKYDEIINNGNIYIIEEKIKQERSMSEFSPTSVNTLRMVTIVDDNGNVHIANALFRIGNGKDVDNFSSGGMLARVDIKTGIIIQCAMDSQENTYIIHPYSGKQIVGFKIPYWDDYVKFSIQLASVMKDVRYVGWDIVRNDDGEMIVIEGNKDAGIQSQEAPVNYGYGPVYEALLHNDKSFDFSKYGGCDYNFEVNRKVK